MTKKAPAIITIDDHDTADVEIAHPSTGNPLPDGNGGIQSITIFGPESDVYADAAEELVSSGVNRQGKEKNLSTAQRLTNGLKFLVAITKSFNSLDFGSGPIDVKDAKKTYRTNKWLRKQIDENANDYVNFT